MRFPVRPKYPATIDICLYSPCIGECAPLTMRLLRRKPDNNDDFKLVTFNTENATPYAILSHTGAEGEEVTYDELVAGTGKGKAGDAKIRFCGRIFVQDGLQYFCIDTCCIKKTYTAELSTSLSSMFE